MRFRFRERLLLAAVAGGAGVSFAGSAVASNPLEYPDNGSAAFSRGGAWLAVANEPIATHYNPAGLATQGSGLSIEQQLNFHNVCYDRKGPNNTPTGPDVQGNPNLIYQPVCNERSGFPTAIPSISIAWRATDRLGFGFAIVPPNAYSLADNALPLTTWGYDTKSHTYKQVPAPYRYMTLNEKSLIIFPTLGVGYELFKHFRLGAAFVSGIAVINTQSVSGTTWGAQGDASDRPGDHMTDDAIATLQTKDLFVPGVILSLHWSVLPQLDVAVWGRYMDSVKSSEGQFQTLTQVYNNNGQVNPICNGDPATCTTATPNNYPDPNAKPPNPNALTSFKFPIPPEVRVGLRFHQPRTKSVMAFDKAGEVRDPLHDDSFDVEVDGSYTMNSAADVIEVRIQGKNGAGSILTQPTGIVLPPNADRPTGYKDSYGVRLGGQWNAIPDKLGIRAGGWLETQAVDPAYLSINPVGATRWGFGGGIVFRQDFIDISIGYQRHLSAGLDNGGNGAQLTPVGTGPTNPIFNENQHIPGRTEFRSIHAINGGHVTEDAHAFTLGGTVRF